MAGAPTAKVWPHTTANGSSSPVQQLFYTSPSHPDLRAGATYNNALAREATTRGRGPGPLAVNGVATLQPQGQASGRALSPRSQPGWDPSVRPSASSNGDLQRRPSADYGHNRKTSIVHGVPQHSRNTSFTNSPTQNHRSPQLPWNGSFQTGAAVETLGFSVSSPDTPDSHNSPSPSSTTHGSMHSFSSTTTLIPDHITSNGGDNFITQKRIEQIKEGKPRRDHNRSHSKNQQPEQRSVGEYALHHLFNSFVGQADAKINQCASNTSGPEPRVEDICGAGVDLEFDQLISALGHIARQKPKPLIDTVMYWRKAKGEAANTARTELSQARLHNPTLARPPPRRNGEPPQVVPPSSDPNYAHLQTLTENSVQAERRSALSIYLLCRVLIEVYLQSDLASITAPMAEKLEDIIFDQLLRTEPENLVNSPFRLANWTIFSQLLGVMSAMCFLSVTNRFIQALRNFQRDIGTKGAGTKDLEDRVELIILAMKNLRIRVQPESAWKDSCDFMHTLGEFFSLSHGQSIKHAYCQVFETLIFPVVANPSPITNNQRWREFLQMLNPRLIHMQVKPRHWQESFPLWTLLLCASPYESFMSQWLTCATSLQAKLKDRLTRSYALQAICRLVWTYLRRTNDLGPTIIRKLEDIVKLVLPTGKKPYLSTDPAFAEPIIELIRIIGHRYQDFCFKLVVFPLINSEIFTSGRDIKVEQLEPERIVVGIRAFLIIMDDIENPEKGAPPFPFFNDGGYVTDPESERHFELSMLQVGQTKPSLTSQEDRLSKLDENAKEYHARFCKILGQITLLCDNTFGGQAVLDEKFSGPSPKTPIADTFSFSRKDDHLTGTDYKQGFYELLHVAVQALPRYLSSHVPFNALINLLCTGTAHVQSNIAVSSASSLKAIARQSHSQPVTIGFARFIFSFNVRYSTMSDEGMLGPGHIENTLRLYVELLQIWIEEIRQKIKNASGELNEDGTSSGRSLPLDLTSVSAVVEEIESHGVFFLCSQSRRVRSFAVNVLRLITEFDTALGKQSPRRIIQILDGDLLLIIDANDARLTVAERSRIQKGKRKSAPQNTLIELCGSEISYDSTLWSKIFPNLIRLSFEDCPLAVALGRELVCARLLQMQNLIMTLTEGSRVGGGNAFEQLPNRAPFRLGSTPPEVFIEQWKLYLVMACTTLTNAGAQTQSQLLSIQHARSKSKANQQGTEKISSARALFASIIPLLSAQPNSIRDAIVTALGSINFVLYRTLLESLQYAVTTCNEEAKVRVGTHQRTGSSPRKNRRTDRLRTEVTHVYRLTSKFLHEDEVLKDEWILSNLIKYTDDMRIFLSDAEVQSDWEFQTLRRHYCGLVEEVFEGINRTTEPARWMSFEARKAAFALIEDWCGYSPNQIQISQREDSMRQSAIDQYRDNGERTNVTAAIEKEKDALKTAALSAMASLCAGPISIIIDRQRVVSLSFDVRRMRSWIDQIFSTESDKLHAIGRRALMNLLVHNKGFPSLLEHAIDMCIIADRPKALESYFDVISQVLMDHSDYPLPFWRILCALLVTLGSNKSSIRMKSVRLLRTMEQRLQKNSKLQDFDIRISDKTTAVYKLAQFEISQRLAKQHTELAFFIFSQFSKYYKDIHTDRQRNMVAAILPWVQIIELQLDPNGGPTAHTYMLLSNLLEITTKSSSAMHNEVLALWQALATGPHGGNVQLVLDFVIMLCLDRREQSFIDYAKQIVVFLSKTPAGQKVVDFLLMQITPKNMVHHERPKLAEISPEVPGMPYVADLGDTLPIGNKQPGFSMGQLSLILLVDLMVGSIHLAPDSVLLLLQVCIILWDQYTVLVQEQAREMLVHLIHELVISKIEDNTTEPKKEKIEDFVEAIRQHKPEVVWSYQESNGKEEEEEGNRVPVAMNYVTNEVINLFALAYPDIHERWAKETLSWATSCSVRHLACRSFQIFRCILSSLNGAMLADMLARLSNTVADEAPEVQTFSMEILTTLKTIIAALEPADLLKYPQLFWATCACLNTVNECEFIETLGMLEKLLGKINFSDPAVLKILSDAKPEKWEGTFEGVLPLVYKGLKSANSLQKTLTIITLTSNLPDSDLIGDQSRLLYGILANLPRFLHSFSSAGKDPESITTAKNLAAVAESVGYQEITIVLNTYANSRYPSSGEFLTLMLQTIQQSFFPAYELKSLVFLMGFLTNRLPWYKLKTMQILCTLIPKIDMRRPELACHGPDLIAPLLRLLQTEYCPQALEVMDHILTISASATPMDSQHLRMSMLSSGSRSVRKEYERTQSLYGIPQDTGWSIPMPAIQSSITRANVHAVFYTCATANTSGAAAASATPEIEFDAEEFQNGSYFSLERADTMMSEDTRVDPYYDSNLDLVSKLDSLDDFFEDDDDDADAKYPSGYSDVTITGFPLDPEDNDAELYDQQTAPILNMSLARTGSVSSLHSNFIDSRAATSAPLARDPIPMNPTAFTTNLPTSAPQIRPSLHSRSITSPSSSFLRPGTSDLLSDSEADEVFSDDERSTGNKTKNESLSSMETMIRRTKTSARRLTPVATGTEFRKKDFLKAQSRARSKSHAPNSPEVPKVPEAYLQAMKAADV